MPADDRDNDDDRRRDGQRSGRPPSGGGRPSGGRSGSGRPSGGRPSGGRSDRTRGASGAGQRRNEGDGRSNRGSGRGTGKSGGTGDRPRGERSASYGDRPFSRLRDEREVVDRSENQAKYDGPPIPEDITGKELDKGAQAQLKSLPEKLAARVARHLVAAARLMDSDPESAYLHTLAARARAARVPIVREASGEAAYSAGRFKDALAEFKAARRMSGNNGYLPMMADCERALGRPERALALAKEATVLDLDDAGQIEMRIVAAGARRDLGDLDGAIRSLEGRELRTRSRAPWVARIRYAYADLLAAAGREDEAREWFERSAAVDTDGYTDAAERIAELEGLVVVDTSAEEDHEADRGASSTADE